jgi:hypothetical protein
VSLFTLLVTFGKNVFPKLLNRNILREQFKNKRENWKSGKGVKVEWDKHLLLRAIRLERQRKVAS